MRDEPLRRWLTREAQTALRPTPEHRAARAPLLHALERSDTPEAERRAASAVLAMDVVMDVRDRDRVEAWRMLALPAPLPSAAPERMARRDENASRLETLLWARAVLVEQAEQTGGVPLQLTVFERWLRDEWRLRGELPGTSHLEQRMFARQRMGLA